MGMSTFQQDEVTGVLKGFATSREENEESERGTVYLSKSPN